MSLDFNEEIKRDFLQEATFLMEQCEQAFLDLEKTEDAKVELAKIFRLAHSLKGAGAAVGFADLAKVLHIFEDCLSHLRAYPEKLNSAIVSSLLKINDFVKERIELLKQDLESSWSTDDVVDALKWLSLDLGLNHDDPTSPQAEASPAAPTQTAEAAEERAHEEAKTTEASIEAKDKDKSQKLFKPNQTGTIKVDTERIENVLDIVGELVVIKSQLINETTHFEGHTKLVNVVSLLDKTIRDLQDKTLGIRMTPLRPLFFKAQRIARDLSIKLKKSINFETEGEDTEVDRNMVELISDPIMHIIRNSLDHGLESPEDRMKAGKSTMGNVSVTAHQSGGRVVLKVKDDGRGIDRNRVITKALEKGLLPPATDPASLSDSEAFALIFAPGLSTAAEVTDVSGRGVGLDVVKTNIEKLKGSIDVESQVGVGTCFTITIPLTTSITEGILVKSGNGHYLIPIDNVREILNINEAKLTTLTNGERILLALGRFVPIYDLQRLFWSEASRLMAQDSERQSGQIVVIETGSSLFSIFVDQILGQSQVVLKPLPEFLKTTSTIAGAAILGDGKVALVLDLDVISKLKLDLSQKPPQSPTAMPDPQAHV